MGNWINCIIDSAAWYKVDDKDIAGQSDVEKIKD